MSKREDLTGKKFSMLTAVKFIGINNLGISMWLFKCDCGHEKIINSYNVSNGFTVSCGCFSRKLASERCIIRCTKHGKARHILYRKWVRIKSVCNNKKNNKYKRYGERGIKVCNEWENDFMSFYNWAISNGWSQELQIDRIDNNGNYEPNNCRFVTSRTNNQNQRQSKIWVINGNTFNSANDASKFFGLSKSTIHRMCQGQNDECYSINKY